MQELCELCKEVPKGSPIERKADFAQRIRKGERVGTRFDAIRAHARSYLYGDSRLIPEAKSVVETFYGSIEVLVWLFPKVKVSSGSVLLFGSGANTLLASELEIEKGGQVLSFGSLTVNVHNLRKTEPINFFEAVSMSAVLDSIAAKPRFRFAG